MQAPACKFCWCSRHLRGETGVLVDAIVVCRSALNVAFAADCAVAAEIMLTMDGRSEPIRNDALLVPGWSTGWVDGWGIGKGRWEGKICV